MYNSFNCELEAGDVTMYGTVVSVTRINDAKVQVDVAPPEPTYPSSVFLKAAGVTRVRN